MIGTEPVSFVLNGTSVSCRDDHPHLLAALREELDVTSPKDGCSPSGQCGCCTVLVDGKARRSAASSRWPRSRARRSSRSRASTDDERAALRRRLRRLRRPAVRLLHPGHRRAGQGARSTRRAPTSTRDDMARHLGAHLCRCTGYVKILDAIEAARQGRARRAGAAPGGVGTSGTRVRGASSSRSATAATSTTSACPGMLHGALHLADHARADVVAHRHDAAAAACPASSRVFTAADVPGELRVGLIHKDWPVIIPEGGRTSYAGDVLAVVVADDRAAGARRGRALVEVDVRRAARRSPTRSPPSTTPRIAVWGPTATCCRVSDVRARRRRRRAGRQRPRRARGVPDPAHRARLPRAGVDAGRARPATARAARVLGRPGRVGRPRPDRVGARHRRRRASPSSWCRTAARSAARRT